MMNNNLKTWLRLFVRMSLFAVALLWPAGTWQWLEAWIVIGLWTVYGVFVTHYLLQHDPALLAERMKLAPLQKEQKSWDKILMLVFFITGIGLYIVPGLDVVRYEWSEPLPVWMKSLAMLVHLPCFMLLGWIMRENTYLSQVVKIDKKRGHKVITTGPYTLVRHPMYTVTMCLLLVFPVALGSRFALALALFLIILLIIRTYFEDCMLHHELSGYENYARKTRYRLIPGVW